MIGCLFTFIGSEPGLLTLCVVNFWLELDFISCEVLRFRPFDAASALLSTDTADD